MTDPFHSAGPGAREPRESAHSAQTDDPGDTRRAGATVRPLPGGLSALVCRSLSHLLVHQEPLRRKLATHAGAAVRFSVRMPGELQTHTDAWIDDQGYLQTRPVAGDSLRRAELIILPSASLPVDWLRHGRQALSSHVQIEGDILVGGAVAEVLSQVKWDFEDDLSRVVGDAAAHRIGEGVRAVVAKGRRLGNSMLGVMGRRGSHENGPLASRAELDRHADELKSLATRIGMLER